MTYAVIFDWGGVLMQTTDHTSRHTWDKKLNQEPGTVEKVVHGIPEWRALQHGHIEADGYHQAIADALAISVQDVKALLDDFYAGDELNTDLIALIRRLKEKGIPVGLMSNNTLDLAQTLIDLEVNSLFDHVVISAEIGVMKPAPGAYQAILNQMNIPANKAIFIDDFIENVAGAQAVGMTAIHYQPGCNLEKELNNILPGN